MSVARGASGAGVACDAGSVVSLPGFDFRGLGILNEVEFAGWAMVYFEVIRVCGVC